MLPQNTMLLTSTSSTCFKMTVQGLQLPHPAALTLTVVTLDLKGIDFLLTCGKILWWKIILYSLRFASSSLTSDVRKVLSNFPAVWASIRVFLVFIQAGFAVDSPTTHYLVGTASHKKTDLTHQFVWWWIYKFAVIPSDRSRWDSKMTPSIGSHLLQLQRITYIFLIVQQAYIQTGYTMCWNLVNPV